MRTIPPLRLKATPINMIEALNPGFSSSPSTKTDEIMSGTAPSPPSPRRRPMPPPWHPIAWR
ncbi:hypothetical protein Droror1_Dr00025779, partial [Drosera rotundifolia]